MSVKAVFFDFDYTLYSHKKKCIPQSAFTALEKLHENGIKIFLATGRNTNEMVLFPEYKTIPFDGFVMLNGQICLDRNFNVVFANPFKGRTLENLVDFFNKKTMPVLFVEKDSLYLNYHSEIVDIATSDIACIKSPVGQYSGNPLFLAVAYIPKEEEESLHSLLPGTSFQRWGKMGIDIVAEGMDKTKGIEMFCKRLGINKEDTMVFGDSFNDVRMIEWAGIGVAMGNAVPEVKKVASFVTEDIDRDGVFSALKHFNLI